MPDNELTPVNVPSLVAPTSELTEQPAPVRPRGIAPVWHTVVLVVGILAFSIWGAMRADSGLNPLAPVHSATHPAHRDGASSARLMQYALTGVLELGIVGWVAFGLRLRKTPFRSLFGAWPRGLNNLTTEAGVAGLFWICSMVVLAAVALSWNAVETNIYEHHLKAQTQDQSQSSAAHPKLESPFKKQSEMAKQLMEIAPANAVELTAWGFLCILVGFSEELIFRGYLQSQSIALLHRIPLSVVLTALIFGAAHGYEGLRNICIIAIYGALFGSLTLLRRSLFPGMLAHAWHDFATGLLLSLLRSSHILEHLPMPK